MSAEFPLTLCVSPDSLPNEYCLTQIEAADALADGGSAGARWLVNVFPRLVYELEYGSCLVVTEADREFNYATKRIEFHTEGCDGCESLMRAVENNEMLCKLYLNNWHTPDHYTFIVPVNNMGNIDA